MKIKLSLLLIVLALLAFVNNGKAQYEIDPIYYTQFSPDSLEGFDENAARASVISEGSYGPEIKVALYRLKRAYIDNKYNIVHPVVPNNTNNYLNASRPAAVPGCVNEDFEASAAGNITTSNQVNGWTVNSGYNGNIPASSTNTLMQSMLPYYPGGLTNPTSCNLLGCCPMPPQNSAIVDCSAPGGFIDTYIGAQYPIFSVFGTGTVTGANAANPQIQGGLFGTKVIRINDELISDYSMEKLSKTFAVTAQNALFQFAFISIFAPGHGCCDAGGFQIRLSNATANTVIPCPSFSVSAPSSQCTGTVPYTYYNVGSGTTYSPGINGGNIYHPWNVNSMDLSAYIGQNITIDIIVSDCNQSGHFGCVYFDAQCGPMTIYGNGTAYDAGTNVVVPTCGAAGATICAANGLGPYSWAGPGLTTNNTIPSYTNQCIITNVSAQYTLYMSPAGSCAPIQRLVTSTITPAPLLVASALQATCGALTAAVSVTPSGSASNPSSLIWSPVPQTLNSTTTSATYTLPNNLPMIVTITASDPLGCLVTATANVNPAPPIPTFTVQNVTNSNSITCEFPSINLVANTNYNYNGGTLDYFWQSASTTYSTNNVNITNPGSYTVQGIDPVTQCGTVTIVSIGVNTVAPTAAISPTMQSVICGSSTNFTNIVTSTSPTVNVSQYFFAPTGGVYSLTANSATYNPNGVGTFTYMVKNDINGCFITKEFTVTSNQGFPIYQVVSPQSFTLGCNSTSFAVVQIVGGTATNSLQLPNGGAVSYSIIGPPTSSVVAANGTLSPISSYTLTVPGTWTVLTRDNVSFCETRTPISILSNTFAPNISALVPQQILSCYVPKITLTGQSLTDNVGYTWLFPGTPGTLESDTIQILANFSTPNASLIANYTLEVTDKSSTCNSFSVITMNQNLFPPKAGITNGGINALTCKTGTITLTNLSSTGIPATTGYPTNLPIVGSLWEGPSPQEPLGNSTTYLASTSGEYTLTAKDLNNGCTSQTVTTIFNNIIYPILDQTQLVDTLDCGAKTTTITPVVSNPTPGLSYEWTTPPGSTVSTTSTKVLTIGDVGMYSVLVTNTINGCANQWEMEVINGSLTANFTPDPVSGYAPLTVNFKNTSSSSASGSSGTSSITSVWNFGNGSSVTYTSVQSASTVYNQPGTYTITLYATKGSCSESKKQIVTVEVPSSLVIPNVFTPNNDGVNDLYFVKASNLSEISAVIIDRWGHKVYELISNTGNIEWDGKNMLGKEAAEGTYFYVIKATGKDGKAYEYKGQISLLR